MRLPLCNDLGDPSHDSYHQAFSRKAMSEQAQNKVGTEVDTDLVRLWEDR